VPAEHSGVKPNEAVIAHELQNMPGQGAGHCFLTGWLGSTMLEILDQP
jgi:hypothetical protein